MRKKIYAGMLLLSLTSVLLVSVALSFLFYGQLAGQIKSELHDNCVFLERVLRRSEQPEETLRSFSPPVGDLRVSLVSAEGHVLYDNDADVRALSRHADREEIREALETGQGESTRFSTTLRTQTHYFSLKLTDDLVLRVSKTTDSIYGVFAGVLPVVIGLVLLVLLACHLTARRLTKSIVAPLGGVDFDRDDQFYDELAPFVSRIRQQTRQIAWQTEELEARAETLTTITDNMKEGLLLLAPSGLIVSANKSVLTLFDKQPDVVGRPFRALSRHVELGRRLEDALAGQHGELLFELGGHVWNIFFSPVPTLGALALFLDITERARAEKRRREFSANVSHELKTPLTSISGYAEMMENGMVSPGDVAPFAGRIRSEASRLIGLIEDIIRLSELDETVEKVLEPVDILPLAEEVIADLTARAAAHDVRLSADCAAFSLTANRRMLHEMLYNLIDNGIKYNKPGGHVTLRVVREGAQAVFSVTDSGIGIPDKDRDRIFERFYRVDRSRSQKTGGTGLGLSIVKHIVAYHGGEVTVDSREDVGTEITVKIPD